MKRRLGALLLALTGQAFGAYVYDSTASGSMVENGDPAYWGSTIWDGTVSGNASDYEVSSAFTIWNPAGVVMQMLRASAPTIGPGEGSYISVEFNLATAPVTMAIRQRVNGVSTQLAAASITLNTGVLTTVRSVVTGTTLTVRVNGLVIGAYSVPQMSGYGGMAWQFSNGASAYSSNLKVGHRDSISPAQIGASVALSLNSNRIGLKWQPSTDDTNGIGIKRYEIRRDGILLGSTEMTPTTAYLGTQFSDHTAVAGTQYSYGLTAVDDHGNSSVERLIAVTAPPATFPDPRRVGVRPEGAYWGAGGEQIDLLSGNLNFTLPAVSALQRSGGKVPISLSYNSQNWRQDGGVNWQLGSDIGYGFGWKVQVGAITPYYVNWTLGVDHYKYTDGTGAEYRLDVNTGGVWTSTQAVYLWFDANTSILHFRDGSSWVMGCTSQGLEPDAGTMYPTIIEDVHGNQVVLKYLVTGTNPPAENGYGSSGRISTVQDVRSDSCTQQCAVPTFRFNYVASYNGDVYMPRLQTITSLTGTHTFTFASVALPPPIWRRRGLCRGGDEAAGHAGGSGCGQLPDDV